MLDLKKSILTDNKGRTGYISSSYQFQFDGPPQSGALITAGFSACSNGSLALGSTSVFWQCLSGDFYNLYDRNFAPQCEPIEIVIMPCGKGSGRSSNEKQKVIGRSVVATTVVTVVSNGKTQVLPTTIVVPMCQIGDGQVQVRTTPCDNMQIPIVTAPPVSQSSNGRLQIPSSVPAAPPAPVGPADVPATQGGAAPTTAAPVQPASKAAVATGTANPAGGVNPAGNAPATGAANPTGAVPATGGAAGATGGVNPAGVCEGANATAAECIAAATSVKCEGDNATAAECIAVATTAACEGADATAAECIAAASGADSNSETTFETVAESRTILKFDTSEPTATGGSSDATETDSNSAPASNQPTSGSSSFTPNKFAVILVTFVAGAAGALFLW